MLKICWRYSEGILNVAWGCSANVLGVYWGVLEGYWGSVGGALGEYWGSILKLFWSMLKVFWGYAEAIFKVFWRFSAFKIWQPPHTPTHIHTNTHTHTHTTQRVQVQMAAWGPDCNAILHDSLSFRHQATSLAGMFKVCLACTWECLDNTPCKLCLRSLWDCSQICSQSGQNLVVEFFCWLGSTMESLAKPVVEQVSSPVQGCTLPWMP